MIIIDYVVQKGDTLYGIARQYGISVSQIMDLNQLKNTNIIVGDILKIPLQNTSTYEVKKGDTLYRISKLFGVSVSELKLFNNLKSDQLVIGQILKVPSSSNSNIYIVKEGDTLYSISKKVGLSVSELMEINHLTSNQLFVGQQLYLTSSTIPLGSSCYGEGYHEVEYLFYTVKKGDSLYSIAKKYGVSVDHLLKLNELSNTNLSIGQVLKIKEVI